MKHLNTTDYLLEAIDLLRAAKITCVDVDNKVKIQKCINEIAIMAASGWEDMK